MSKCSSSSNEDFDTKEQLYSLFYELTSEIKGKEIELLEDDYIENIKVTKLSQIISYLRETIYIFIKKHVNYNKNNDHLLSSQKPLSLSEIDLYEQLLRQNEINERRNIGKYYQIKAHKDVLEFKIGEYIQLEKEFDEMKAKLKYEEGKFLENDRKDNEILILRAENTNLKEAIIDLEQSNKKYAKELNEKDNELDNLKNSIEELQTKIEHSQKELTYYSTNNKQFFSNGTKNAKCVFCGSTLINGNNNNVSSPDKSKQ